MDSFFPCYKKGVLEAESPHDPTYAAFEINRFLTYLEEMSEEEVPEILIRRMWSVNDSCEELKPYADELKKFVFVVPKLKTHAQTLHSTPLMVFLHFLTRLLYQKSTFLFKSHRDQIENLEKDLKFLRVVVCDTSFMVAAHEFINEFEAVANEAGSLVHSLLFGEIDDGISDVLRHFKLLKDSIINLSNDVPCITTSTNNASVVDSVLVLDLLVRDLDHLINGDDYQIADVRDQIQTLHHGLISFQAFINDTNSPPLSRELGEQYMLIGDLSHQAKYLIVSFLAGDSPHYLLSRLFHVNRKIDEICRIDLPNITTKYKSGGSKVAKYFHKQLQSSSMQNRNSKGEGDTVGFEDKLIHVLDHLVGRKQGLQVISIFGMPGLGKTTLAKKLYNHPSVKERFERFSWCIISASYSKRHVLTSILIDIASELGRDAILGMEVRILEEHIHKILKSRRYLIVLDDIWDSNACDELVRCFPDDNNGSRILFTTRDKDIAPPNCIMYELPSLSDEQCWELIQKKVFDNQPCPPELVESGRKIAANCGGMPLAAVVIAGVLSTADMKEIAWEEVGRNLCSHVLDGGDNPVMQILKISYDHLPQHLKLCFLYLGVASTNHHKIPIQVMMNAWICEGFIQEENEKNVAEEYLKALIDKSLVMVVKRRSDGSPRNCLIHDLLHELCLKICEEEKLTRFVNKISKYIDQRRTLTNEVPTEMRLLRVLDWGKYDYFTLNTCIGVGYLVSLKYLIVIVVPPSISNLVNLEFLRVVSRTEISSEMMKMKKLKYINVSGRWEEVPYAKDCSPSVANKLEFLSFVQIKKHKDRKMLKCSPHLRTLKCNYHLKGIQMYAGIDLGFLTRLERLHLSLRDTKDLFGGLTMTLPSTLKKLTLSCNIYISRCKLSSKTMSMIGKSKNLEILKLKGVKFEGKRWDTRDGEFEKLKYMKLDQVMIREWNVESSECFHQLQHLVFARCRELEEIPVEIGEIPTLRIIEVDEHQEASATRILEEQRDLGNDDLTVQRYERDFYNDSIWSD